MDTLDVELGDRSYPIYIGDGLFTQKELLLDLLAGHQVLVVTNTTVSPLYLDKILAQLDGLNPRALELEDGEQYKTLDTVTRIFDALLEQRFSRNSTLIALGGGVIGDITGFAAACYQRGVNFIQIPTTLLAQVDSSVGGKTGVNHPLGKNMIGAFYQPKGVIIDISALTTLPDRELKAGIAEVIKYGLIDDSEFFEWIELNLDNILKRERKVLTHAIRRSCEIKAEIVAADEKEAGIRAILNFGHTFGHAIEAGCGYGVYLHGEAVSIGMCLAAELSCRLDYISLKQLHRIIALLERTGLPTTLPEQLSTNEYLKLMAVDKKNIDGEIRVIVLEQMGKAGLPVSIDTVLLKKTIQDYGVIRSNES
ncbi:MAG TPA: 3-dehydroquinate synthase [Crenotrichaceae bacterium]|nr:3-dehydroquinate synthase [Crenotrichaceae bacterium]